MDLLNAQTRRILKLYTNEQWNDWHKYVSLATFIYSCCPSAVFHGREPIKPLDLQFLVKSLETETANSGYVPILQDAMLEKFKETKGKLIALYQRY